MATASKMHNGNSRVKKRQIIETPVSTHERI
jgi:hypothetical protein